MEERTTRKTSARWMLLLGVGIMIFAGGRLISEYDAYRRGATAYGELRQHVKGGARAGIGSMGQESARAQGLPVEATAAPELDIDFEALQALNEDAVAWLYCPDTAIDYPVMKAQDYGYYLDRLPDGTRNKSGSLFIDFNCAWDFGDMLTVVYGHNMKNGTMFGSLAQYKSQQYYEAHPSLFLYTAVGNARIDLLYGCVIDEGQWRQRAFMYAQNLESLLSYAARNTTFTSSATYQQGDKVVALSTCSYEFDGARYVVVGRITAC